MAVDDATVGDPLGEERLATEQVTECVVGNTHDLVGVENRGREGPQLLEISRPQFGQPFPIARAIYLSARRRDAMDLGERYGDAIDAISPACARRDHGESAVVRHPTHLHQGVDERTLTVIERDHSEIDIGREPPIQSDLALRVQPAPRRRREVDEGKADRLLELPDPIWAQPENRDVRLGEPDGHTPCLALQPRPKELSLFCD
ncbi:MAG TPA: hypothetical protein VIK54_11745 [Acidimicrobiia bacterium]